MSCQRKDILTLHLFLGEHPVCSISTMCQSLRHIHSLLGPSPGRCVYKLMADFEKSFPSILYFPSRNRDMQLLPKKNILLWAM